MKQKSTILSLCLAFLLAAVCLFALPIEADAATDGYYTYTVSGGKATITDCDPAISGHINIPSTLGGYPVTSIGDYAFSRCNSLTSITIPDSVTSIGNYAFQYCSSLTSITIPDSVTSIGSSAFSGCSSLESMTIPFVGDSGKTSTDTYQYPFGYIFGTTSYTGGMETKQYYYGSSSTSTTNSTYYIPTSLKSVTVTGGEILRGAFYNCSSLKSITILDSVTSIGDSAFNGCFGLTSISIPDSVACIGNSAFKHCSRLTSVTIPDAVTTIGEYAFENCDGLSGIIIPDSVDSVAVGLFYNCNNLTSITIPNSVTSIGNSAFNGCSNLSSIMIPDSVTSIGDSAFHSCNNLTSIMIPDGVTSIGNYVFYHCYRLTSITIPDGVYSIGEEAFRSCSSLQSITIPDSTTSIGEYAFSYCGLTSITIPDSVTSIGVGAFEGCVNLRYHIYDNAQYLENGNNPYFALINSTSQSITTCNIHSETKVICGRAFYKCTGLTNIIIPDGVTGIGDSAFLDCSSLTSITIPDSVTSIGDCAFGYCSSLTSITIPDSVNSIGDSAFYFCECLENVNVPDGVNRIGDWVFSFCRSLKSITIPDGVTSIGYCAFQSCDSLTSVTIPDSTTSIGDSAFRNCGRLEEIVVPDSVAMFGDYAFDNCTNLDDVIYCGTQEQWNTIAINVGNDLLHDVSLKFHDYQYGICTICQHAAEYTVVFRNWDGAILSSKTYHWGDKVTVPATPTKAADNTYTYAFAGWDQEIVDCEGNATYTASYKAICYIYAGGSGTSEDPFLIETKQHLDNVRLNLNAYFKLCNDIVFADEDFTSGEFCNSYEGWAPIGSDLEHPFSGSFNGNGKTIYGYHQSPQPIRYTYCGIDTVSVFAGLFGAVSGGEIYDLSVANSKIYIQEFDPHSMLKGHTYAGFIAGIISFDDSSDTILRNCHSVGNSFTQVSTLDGEVHYGGIVGYAGDTVNTVYPTGTIRLSNLSNESYLNIVSRCYSTTVGGVVGGCCTSSRGNVFVENCWNTGYVTVVSGNPSFAPSGGIVGDSSVRQSGSIQVTNCFNTGKVSSRSYSGDIVGHLFTDGSGSNKLQWCYTVSDGMVCGTVTEESSAKNCYAVSQEGASAMMALDTFEGFDFESVWVLGLTDGYPYPQLQDNPVNWNKTVTSIEMLVLPNKLSYFGKKERLDVTGGVIRVNYNNFITEDIRLADEMVLGFDNTMPGSQILVVSYGDMQTTFEVYITTATVTFRNWNGEILSSGTYMYGDEVAAPVKPIKASDETYRYVFSGWDKEVTVCTGDAEYMAIYTPTYINYTVLFQNWNGDLISKRTYHWGDKVTAPAAPTKAADNTYTYAFDGWDKTIVNCAGDATYTATYESTYIDYTVVFKNWDGTVLSSKTCHWGDKVTAPAAPSKTADNTYTYAFNGWDKTVVNCAGNATYTATYKSTYIDYTVVFKNWDGTVLSSKTCHWGDKVTAPAAPTKAADNTYTYAFNGWDKTIVNCAGDATYTATYKSTYIDYTVVFKNWDGTVLSSKTYHWGDKVTAPAAPTKAADNTYTYAFDGWDNQVVNCAGDATYTATYESTYIDYTVVFKDWDGTILSSNTYHWGDKVTAPAAPTKAADNTYTYAFNGWDKTIVNCVGDATYTATYESTYIDYTVVFKDWDGTILSSNTYHWGDKVTAPAAPTKAADNTYTYAFAGWDNEVVNCAGDATYTATYDSTYIDYTVVFKNWDGTVLSSKTYHWGDKVTAPATPTKAADNTYTYAFAGWDNEVVNCAGAATYTATYESTYIDYTVVFKDWDGTILSSKTYHWGDKVTAPAAPSKVADNTYTYAFAGWDNEVVNCAGDATYTAIYESAYIDYIVQFVDWDGSIISSESYHWGDAVTVPEDPTREADELYKYTFIGWDKEIVPCAGDATYTAQYEAVKKLNGWVSENGKWYYYRNGAKTTGWLQDGGVWYYMDGQGVMQTGWKQIGGIWYYFKSSGAMVTGWLQVGGTWYYFNTSGAMVTGWLQSGSTWYYFNSSGAMVTGTVTIGGKVNKFDASGVWLGEVSQNGWVQEGGKWYYYQNGAKATGWKQISGKWYYFNTSGVMQTGWLQVGGTWYYFQSGGAMQTGWLKIGNIWYYFHSSGAMATSPVTLGGKTYRFDANGACLNP